MKKIKCIGVTFILLVAVIFIVLIIKEMSNRKELIIDNYSQLYLYKLEKSNIEIIKKNNSVILINTGTVDDREELIDLLSSLEIYEIDYLIVTNKNDKYIGNVSYLIDNYLIDYIYINDYEYSSSVMDNVNLKLNSSYTEKIILNSNEKITLDDLVISIFPFTESTSYMDDKTLIVKLEEGDNFIYLTSNSSDKRLDGISKGTILVSENSYLFSKDFSYFVYDGISNRKNKSKTLKRDLKIYFNSNELIIK